ncbi:uncharacterized [Tachysurus ichikawai]
MLWKANDASKKLLYQIFAQRKDKSLIKYGYAKDDEIPPCAKQKQLRDKQTPNAEEKGEELRVFTDDLIWCGKAGSSSEVLPLPLLLRVVA